MHSIKVKVDEVRDLSDEKENILFGIWSHEEKEHTLGRRPLFLKPSERISLAESDRLSQAG